MTRTPTTPYGPLITTRTRVATWNLWWRLGDWETRAEAIARTLEDLRPDLVCLQEVWQEGDRNQAALLADRLALQHTFAPDRTAGGVDQGVALLSRWPLTEIECRPLPVPPCVEQPSVALRAVVVSWPSGPGGIGHPVHAQVVGGAAREGVVPSDHYAGLAELRY